VPLKGAQLRPEERSNTMISETAVPETDSSSLEPPTPGIRALSPPSSPKIVFLIDELTSITAGGTERQLLQLVAIAQRIGLSPQICVLRGSKWLTAEVAGCPVRLYNLDKIKSREGLRQIGDLVRWLREEKFKILQTLFLEANFIGPFLGRMARIPVILGSRRNLNHDDNWKKFGFQSELARQWFSNFFVDQIVSNSIAVRDRVSATEWTPKSKFRVIYNGIDPEAIRPQPGMRATMRAQLGLAPTDVLVGNISGLRPVKAVDVFVEAAAIAHAENPSLRFVSVGEGAAREDIEKLIEARNLSGVLTLAGAIEDVRPYLAAMDIGVLSSHAEGFSNSILEYMAVGLPTIATDVGGNREALEGVGILVPAGNAKELACAIGSLGDAAVRAEYAKASLRAIGRFDIKVAEQQIATLYAGHLERIRQPLA
jgi:L-malate glycosyltransferase